VRKLASFKLLLEYVKILMKRIKSISGKPGHFRREKGEWSQTGNGLRRSGSIAVIDGFDFARTFLSLKAIPAHHPVQMAQAFVMMLLFIYPGFEH
jgi:hypothetical protein